MLTKETIVNESVNNPVAILDKDLMNAEFFKISLFEFCSICGARFGIGYHRECGDALRGSEETEELPRKLTEILAKDHRQNRDHKHFIELDF